MSMLIIVTDVALGAGDLNGPLPGQTRRPRFADQELTGAQRPRILGIVR